MTRYDLSVNVGWDFKSGIANANQLPIPGFGRDVVPLEFEWPGSELTRSLSDSIDFALGRHRSIILPIHSARRRSTRTVMLNALIRTPRTYRKSFTHAFKNTRTIIAPLILIIATDEILRGSPVFVFNRVEKVFGVKAYLTFRLPKHREIQSDAKRED